MRVLGLSISALLVVGAAAVPYTTSRQTAPVASCNATTAQTYTIVSGDTLTTIAEKFSVGICDIAKASDISNVNFISVGQVVTIPGGVCTPDNTSCLSSSSTGTTGTCVTGGSNSYLVRSGDTLTSIAANFGITLAALEAANSQIANFDLIDVSQLINIPVCDNTECKISTYSIVSGDTLFDLSQKNGVTLGQVLALNLAANVTDLQIGQQVILPSNCSASN